MAAPLPVICLAGPTGCGKTAAALALAEALDGEVINADSRQVYSDFPLITAQPSPEEQACCPHHLYGFLPTEQKISAGRWADQAVAAGRGGPGGPPCRTGRQRSRLRGPHPSQ